MNMRACLLVWVGLAGLPVAAAADCGSPVGQSGQVVYASPQNVLVFCDGSNWISMAGGVSVTIGGGADPRIGTLGSSGQWCTTNGSQINCASAAPPLNGGTGANTYLAYWSSGNQLEGNSGLTFNSATDTLNAVKVSTTGLSVSGIVTATGYVSATTFYGDGSHLTGISTQGDRIVSGTTSMVAQTANSIISISTGGINTGYFNSNGVLTVPGISATANLTSVTSLYASGNVGIGTITPTAKLEVSGTIVAGFISATAVQMTSDTTVCSAGTAGRVTYAGGSLMLCNGTSWSNVGIGVPAGTISAFASAICPAGWVEFTAARGAFLRGIDNGAGVDPSGTRTPGDYQGDLFRSHYHGPAGGYGQNAFMTNTYPEGAIGVAGTGAGIIGTAYAMYSTGNTGGSETRPKNVAVTFCRYTGVGGTYSTVSSSLVAGSDTQIQYNSNGGLAASPNFTFSTNVVTVNGSVTATNIYASNISSTTGTFGGIGAGNINASGVVSATGVTANGVPVMAGMFYKADPDSVAFTKTGAGTVSIKAGTVVQVGTYTVNYANATAVSMPSLTAGTDYAIYACGNGAAVADSNWTSTSSCANGYRKIGGFHYAPGGNATGTAGGDTTPAINAYSLWDLKWRPRCDPRGMTLVAGSFWVDIYLTNTLPDTYGTSRYNVTIADSGNPPKVPAMFGGNGSTAYTTLDWYSAAELMKSQGKELLSQSEFSAAAYGTTENSSIGTDQVSTILNAAYTSKWGVMQATGVMWVWSRDQSYRYDAATWAWKNVNGGRGQVYSQDSYGIVYALFGGSWTYVGFSGSRASTSDVWPWASGVNVGARGRCDHVRLE